MAHGSESGNKFEFVIVAGARARQLLRGCPPKSAGSDKLVRLAQREVLEGKVTKLSGIEAVPAGVDREDHG
jgi:DNA-directed RNA polymerase subunit K/omega